MADKAASVVAGATETSPLTKQSSSHYDLEYNPLLNEPQMKADFIFRVYSLLSAQLLVTFAIACWMCFTEQGKIVGYSMHTGVGGVLSCILTIVLIVMFSCCYKDTYPANLVLFTMLTFLLGSDVGFICYYAGARFPAVKGPLAAYGVSEGMEMVLLAAGITALIFISLTMYVVKSKRDFSFLGGFLFVGLISTCIVSFIGVFLLGLTIVKLVCCIAFILIFTGYILYDTDQIVNKVELKDLDLGTALSGALELYLDIINLFIELLRLMMILAGDR